MGILRKLLRGGDDSTEADDSTEDTSDEAETTESDETDTDDEEKLVAVSYEKLVEMDDEKLPGPDSIDLDSRGAPPGWKCTKNTDYWGIHYKEKGVLSRSTKIKIELIPGAGAQCYRLEPGSDVRHQMINGIATIPEAVAVAKLYMAYGFTPPSCAVKYEPEDAGIGFKRIDLKHYLDVLKQDDRHPLKVHAEYSMRAGDMDDQLNKYYRGEATDPYGIRRY